MPKLPMGTTGTGPGSWNRAQGCAPLAAGDTPVRTHTSVTLPHAANWRREMIFFLILLVLKKKINQSSGAVFVRHVDPVRRRTAQPRSVSRSGLLSINRAVNSLFWNELDQNSNRKNTVKVLPQPFDLQQLRGKSCPPRRLTRRMELGPVGPKRAQPEGRWPAVGVTCRSLHPNFGPSGTTEPQDAGLWEHMGL